MLLDLNILQSEDNTYITIGQGEYTRERHEELGLDGITPVLPLLSLISHSHILTVLLKCPQTLTRYSCVESSIDMQFVTYCELLSAPDQTSYAVSHVSRLLENPGSKYL